MAVRKSRRLRRNLRKSRRNRNRNRYYRGGEPYDSSTATPAQQKLMNMFLYPEASGMYDRLTDSNITPVERQEVIDEYMKIKPLQQRYKVLNAVMDVVNGK